MTRLAISVAVAASTLLLAAPSFAADYFGSDEPLRNGFADDGSDADNPLTFELGLRYWYSWGAQSFNADFGATTASLRDNDNGQAAEAYFRIDDASTNYYAKGLFGTSFDINGSSTLDSTGINSTTPVTDGRISYAGGDIGYSLLGNNPHAKFGPFAGYMYWNDSPNLGRANFTTGTATGDFSYNPVVGVIGPGNSEEDNVEINALRLGVSGKVDLGDYMDVTGELAAVPYAKITGTLGAMGVGTQDSGPGGVSVIQSSPVSLNGWGYGAMAEAMLEFHPAEHFNVGLGARAWYLQGRADSTYNTVTVTNDSTHTVEGQQRYISTANPWSLFRYGLLAQMSYDF
jgi:hypothetical protein